MNKDNSTFEDWFDFVKSEIESAGYDSDVLDRDVFLDDYNMGVWAEAAATEFIEA